MPQNIEKLPPEPKHSDPSRALFLGALVVIVVIIIFAYLAGSGSRSGNDAMKAAQKQTELPPTIVEPPSSSNLPPEDGELPDQTFTVTAANFSFAPATLKVKQGDRVKIILQNSGGTHDWVLDEFNARVTTIQSGQTSEVTFVADKAGVFEFYCSIGEHRQMGMVGTLTVE